MRFSISQILFVALLALVCLFSPQTRGRASDEKEDFEIAKAKAKAIFSLKSAVSVFPESDAPKIMQQAKDKQSPLYIWVGKFNKEIAEKLPKGFHLRVKEWHGVTEPHLVIKIESGEYQLEQSKLDSSRIQVIQDLVKGKPSKEQTSARPPIIETSREFLESEEPPLLAFQKRCLCSKDCSCGCNITGECRCKQTRTLPPQPVVTPRESFPPQLLMQGDMPTVHYGREVPYPRVSSFFL